MVTTVGIIVWLPSSSKFKTARAFFTIKSIELFILISVGYINTEFLIILLLVFLSS